MIPSNKKYMTENVFSSSSTKQLGKTLNDLCQVLFLTLKPNSVSLNFPIENGLNLVIRVSESGNVVFLSCSSSSFL